MYCLTFLSFILFFIINPACINPFLNAKGYQKSSLEYQEQEKTEEQADLTEAMNTIQANITR